MRSGHTVPPGMHGTRSRAVWAVLPGAAEKVPALAASGESLPDWSKHLRADVYRAAVLFRT